MKVTDLLKKDHDLVKELFSQFEALSDRAHQKRSSLIEQIGEELTIHATVEEEIFYPAVNGIRDKEAKFEVAEALQEHQQVKALIEELSPPEKLDELTLKAKMKVLKEDVEHHAEEEEKEMFKEARKLGAERLEELGSQVETRKTELKTTSSDN